MIKLPSSLPKHLEKITPKKWAAILIPFAYTLALKFTDDSQNGDYLRSKKYYPVSLSVLKQIVKLMEDSKQDYTSEGDILVFLREHFIKKPDKAVGAAIYSYLSQYFNTLTPRVAKSFSTMTYRSKAEKTIRVEEAEPAVIEKLLREERFWTQYKRAPFKSLKKAMIYNKLKELLHAEIYSVLKTGHYSLQYLAFSNRTEYTDSVMKACLRNFLCLKEDEVELHIQVRKEYRKLLFDTTSEALKISKRYKPLYTPDEVRARLQENQLPTYDFVWQELEEDFMALVSMAVIFDALLASNFDVLYICGVLGKLEWAFYLLLTSRINRECNLLYDKLPKKSRLIDSMFFKLKPEQIKGCIQNLKLVTSMSFNVVEGNKPLDLEEDLDSADLLDCQSYDYLETPIEYAVKEEQETLLDQIRFQFNLAEEAVLTKHPYLNTTLLLAIYGSRIEYNHLIEELRLINIKRSDLDREINKLENEICKVALDKLLSVQPDIYNTNIYAVEDLKNVIKEYLTVKYRSLLAEKIAEKIAYSETLTKYKDSLGKIRIDLDLDQLDISTILPVTNFRSRQEYNQFKKAVELAELNLNFQEFR